MMKFFLATSVLLLLSSTVGTCHVSGKIRGLQTNSSIIVTDANGTIAESKSGDNMCPDDPMILNQGTFKKMTRTVHAALA